MMSSMVRSLAMPGALVIVAAAGSAAYVVTRLPAPQPTPAAASTATPEAPPAPAFVPGGNSAAAPAAGVQAAAFQTGAMQAPPGQTASTSGFATPVTTAFSPASKPYSLVHDSAAYVAASPDAPQMYPLKAGTAVAGVARSADDKWVIALTETGQAAFLPAVDLGPYDPRLSPTPDHPQIISGVAQVIDTGNLLVDGKTVQLAGIKGEGGVYTAQLQSMISAQGARVQCALQGASYVCTLPNGLDIARAALWNGAAEVADDASDDYRTQAAAARAGHKGIWR